MSEAEKPNNQSENASVPEQQGTDSLEDLLNTLSKQINSTDWLKQNTAEKFEADNPEVAKVFQDLVEEEKKKKNENSADKS